MQIGALGDIHGAFDTVQDIMARHPDVPLWVQVGDVASNDGDYFTPVAAALLDQGQQRGFRRDRRGDGGHPPAATLHYLPNGGPHAVGPWRVAALGGTFAPQLVSLAGVVAAAVARQARPVATSIKLGKSRDDKRRHFVRDEVLACKGLTGHRPLPDPRGAAPVLPGRPPHRRGQDGRSTRC